MTNATRWVGSLGPTALVAALLLGAGCGQGAGGGPLDGGRDGGDGGEADAGDAGPDVELWPEPWELHEALGDLEDVPPHLRPLFVSFGVPPLPEPGPSDWLANYDEPGQTFDQLVLSRPHLPTGDRRVLYVQPLGDPAELTAPTLEELEIFYEAYFSLEARVLEPLDPEEHDITERVNPSGGQRQLLTTDVLRLLARRLPEDAFSLIAVTMVDLYPADDWNYVFGQASLVGRVGVFSFARYGSPSRERTLRRGFAVLAHETGHMFGVLHCTYFHCLMNGSNHLAELDASPIHLCPVDLRKLYWSIQFDPVERYERLVEVYDRFGLHDEADWIEDRLRRSGL